MGSVTAKRIYLVRHAQGEHNISDDFRIQDAKLTPHGKAQCRELRASFPHHDEIQIVMASPLRRAVQTAVEAFAPALRRPAVPLLLVPAAQEISGKPCDVGFERARLEVELERLLEGEADGVGFGPERIDYGIVEAGWSGKEGRFEASLTAVEQRAADLRCWLWQRPETSIVLVTHGAFLHYLTEDWTAFVPSHGTAYKNCEFRCFTFTASSDEHEAHMLEVGGSGVRGVKPAGAHARDISGVILP